MLYPDCCWDTVLVIHLTLHDCIFSISLPEHSTCLFPNRHSVLPAGEARNLSDSGTCKKGLFHQIVWADFQYGQPADRQIVTRHSCRAVWSPLHQTRGNIRPVETHGRASLQIHPAPQPIVSTMAGFKSAITRWINRETNTDIDGFEICRRRGSKF